MSGDASAPLSRGKRIAYIVGALIVVSAIAFGLLEILIRILAPQPGSMRWLVADERYGHVMRPNADERYAFAGTDFVMEVKTNTLGLRDEELQPASEDEKTILFMGDSVTFGHALNVDQRFDTLLGAKLAEAELSYRLINTGVNAWGTLQESLYVRDNFQTFEPDIIVITFTGNDPSDDAYFREKGQSFDEVMFPGKRWLRDHSHLYRLATHYAFILYHSITVKRQTNTEPDAQVDKQSGSVITRDQWSSTREILANFRDHFLAFNPAGQLLLQPAAPQEQHIDAELRAIADDLRFTYIDMTERVQDLPPEDLRLPYDGHWSPLMHAISAEHIFQALQQTRD